MFHHEERTTELRSAGESVGYTHLAGCGSSEFESPATDRQFALAFSIAKEALGYIGTFRTPPTPHVYEVWYRFVEGKHTAIKDQLTHAVNVAQSVTEVQLEQLHQQFLAAADGGGDSNAQISQSLAEQLTSVQSLINEQVNANDEFTDCINSATDSLKAAATTPEKIKAAIDIVLDSNEKMGLQLKEVKAQLEDAQSQIDSLHTSLQQSQKALMTDPLTAVGNRRFFDVTMAQATRVHQPLDRQMYLMLIDLDDFKHINDTFGHAVGDEVLLMTATALCRMAGDASIARIGGDEFAIVGEACGPEQAHHKAEEIRQFFDQKRFGLKNTGDMLGQLTVSIGVSRLRRDDGVDSWFNRADRLLYSAKDSGRNCVRVERELQRG